MQREIRRKDRVMSQDKALRVLKQCEYGVLSTGGPDGQPYGTPLSYVLSDNTIFFHCAQNGHKLENIAFDPRVCFSVVQNAKPVYIDSFSTFYESVTVFGTAAQVTDAEEKTRALTLLCQKYLSEHMDKAEAAIAGSLQRTAVYEIQISRITGKEKLPQEPLK